MLKLAIGASVVCCCTGGYVFLREITYRGNSQLKYLLMALSIGLISAGVGLASIAWYHMEQKRRRSNDG